MKLTYMTNSNKQILTTSNHGQPWSTIDHSSHPKPVLSPMIAPVDDLSMVTTDVSVQLLGILTSESPDHEEEYSTHQDTHSGSDQTRPQRSHRPPKCLIEEIS